MPNVHHRDYYTNELWNIPSVVELAESQKTASIASEQVKRRGPAEVTSTEGDSHRCFYMTHFYTTLYNSDRHLPAGSYRGKQ